MFMYYFKCRTSLSLNALHGNTLLLLQAFILLRNPGREVLWLEIFTFQTVKGGLHEQQK